MTETKLISLALLEEDPDNPRQEIDADADDDLRVSLAADGQLNPLIVTRKKETDKLRVIAGNRRLRMGRLLGWTEMLCQVIEANELTIKKIKLLDNIHRLSPCDIDTALYVAALMSEYGWSQKRVARELSLGQPVVSRFVTMASRLSPDLRASGLPGRILYLLASKVKDHEQQNVLAARVKSEGLTVENLTALLNGKKAKAKKTVIKVKGMRVIVEGMGSVVDALAEALAQVKRQG